MDLKIRVWHPYVDGIETGHFNYIVGPQVLGVHVLYFHLSGFLLRGYRRSIVARLRLRRAKPTLVHPYCARFTGLAFHFFLFLRQGFFVAWTVFFLDFLDLEQLEATLGADLTESGPYSIRVNANVFRAAMGNRRDKTSHTDKLRVIFGS